MILTRPIVIRLVLLGVAAAVLQVSFFSEIRILGSSPDVAILVVMSLGLLGGSLSGTVAGFSIGFLIDSHAPAHDGRDLAGADGGRLRRRPLP